MSDATLAGQSAAADFKKRFGLLSIADLARMYTSEASRGYVVDTFLPRRSVNISVGDSGLGKSPLYCQMGICVGAGIPFLGHTTQQGRVVFLDYENGLADMLWVCTALARYLGLEKVPDDFLIWTYGTEGAINLESLVKECRPVLCIVDSLRAHNPLAEHRNRDAAPFLSDLRRVARKYDTVFLLKRIAGEGLHPGPNGAAAQFASTRL